jgi:hypothetical protein
MPGTPVTTDAVGWFFEHLGLAAVDAQQIAGDHL